MNIFVLDEDPIKSAQMLCDKHVCKMIVESCQLLCSVFYFNCVVDKKMMVVPYKLTHKNHPCAKWVRESYINFLWLLLHLGELLEQYRLRYNKTHKCFKVFEWIIEHKQYLKFNSNSKKISFVQCVPKKYQCANTVEAYRRYYICEKLKFAKWKLGNMPLFCQIAMDIDTIVEFNKKMWGNKN